MIEKGRHANPMDCVHNDDYAEVRPPFIYNTYMRLCNQQKKNKTQCCGKYIREYSQVFELCWGKRVNIGMNDGRREKRKRLCVWSIWNPLQYACFHPGLHIPVWSFSLVRLLSRIGFEMTSFAARTRLRAVRPSIPSLSFGGPADDGGYRWNVVWVTDRRKVLRGGGRWTPAVRNGIEIV
jgi:hypothetical protein